MVKFSVGKVHSQVEGTNDSVFNGDDIFYLRTDERRNRWSYVHAFQTIQHVQANSLREICWLHSTKSGRF